MKKCYIVGAGECSYVPPKPDKDTLLIAADGGYDTLCRLGIKPDLLIGDFDSIKSVPEDIECIRFKVRKDETDMHLAYLEGKRRGCSEFFIYGGTGGRSDHSFANLSLLLYIKKAEDTATLCGSGETFRVIRNEKIKLFGKKGANFSVFAFGREAHGVYVKNAEYEAENATLYPEFPLGVSNAFLDTPAEISVENGSLLIISETE